MSDAGTTTIFLVRHGETPFHAENRYVGSTDAGLTARGHEQARALAGWAAGARLTALAASPMIRARDTATPAAERTGLELRLDDRLRELSFGAGDGLTAAEMRERFPTARAAFEADPYRNPLPGGEDPRAALDRGRQALTNLADGAAPGARVLVVAHSTLLRLLLCDLLGIDPGTYRVVFPRFGNATGAVLRYSSGAGRPAGYGLIALNPPLHDGEHPW